MQHKVNISIDDVSPHSESSVKVLEQCHDLIKEFPEIKFTLFVPIAYWRTMGPTATKTPLRIDEHPEFCEALKALPPKNFELAYHGLLHGIPGKSNNDEFQYINHTNAMQTFGMMVGIVKAAGLQDKFKKIFRPPAWRMSPSAITAAKDFGFEILALSPKQYAKDIYEGYDEKFDKVVYYNVNPPFEPLELFEKTEMVYHACEWDKNYLSKSLKDELSEFIKENKSSIEFKFIGDL
ncbi:MAG TPA: hypothetical protein DEG69_22515 [Flavobacteriaceae bacterium]|nr:hypothetical protein [Flavobacteriaceae bacterium]